MPPAGRASTSRPFSRSMAASEPARRRCTPRTAVTTPMAGSASAARWAMSPSTYMPISSTAVWVEGVRRSRVSGRPTSLFWLPSLASTSRVVRSTAAMASLVEVLATDPVTPTTSGWKRLRHAEATRPSAATPSSTSTTVVSPNWSRLAASGASVTSRAVAPAATAGARKRCPSVRAPGRATKRLPGSTSRESTAAPRIGRPPGSAAPGHRWPLPGRAHRRQVARGSAVGVASPRSRSGAILPRDRSRSRRGRRHVGDLRHARLLRRHGRGGRARRGAGLGREIQGHDGVLGRAAEELV